MILSTSEFFATFLNALQTYFPEQVDPNFRTPNAPQSEVKTLYDFVIVGAGSAGCVLANRLSENPNWTVLLIEAGANDDYISDTPFLAEFLLNTEKDWNYTTIKQEGACLSKGGTCPLHRGKVIGGSSTINDMFYVRGNKEDYEEWEGLGNDGWGYEDVLPYFKKAENMSEPCLAMSGYHGTRGPLNVQLSRYITPFRDRYINAGKEIGWQFADYNAKKQSVIGYQQSTINGALRESTLKAYLNPIRYRKNLNIILESVVSKIIIEDKVAKGVEYFRDNKTHKVFVKKDVVLAAGTVDTPKLLMLSGIGPMKELRKHNIDTVVDLPVGSNYIDHENVVVFFKLHDDAPTITPSIWKTNESVMTFAKKREGPLTMSALGAEASSFFNPLQQNAIPSVMITFCSSANIEDKNDRILRFTLSNLKPKSIGHVTLKSNDFKDPPIIQPNMLKNETDRTTLELGIKKLFRLMETNVLLKYSPKLYTEHFQAKCNGLEEQEYVKCAVLQYSFPGQHCVGTAKMGPTKKQDTVVSSDNLSVKGIKKLRVVDGSIIPTLPRGNTNAIIIMVAEKGADIIKNTYKDNETGETDDVNNYQSEHEVSSDRPKQSNFINLIHHMIKPYNPS